MKNGTQILAHLVTRHTGDRFAKKHFFYTARHFIQNYYYLCQKMTSQIKQVK